MRARVALLVIILFTGFACGLLGWIVGFMHGSEVGVRAGFAEGYRQAVLNEGLEEAE